MVYGFNQNWWKTAYKPKPKGYEPPKRCLVCSCEIKQGDWFNAGYDRYKIWLETCDNIRCKQWLKWKVRKKK